jgi:Domain of unknown function (DUF4157)
LSRQAALGRDLTAFERSVQAVHFSASLLDAVRIVDDRVPFWLRPDMCGVTLGNRIWFRPGAYDAATPAGIELLAHELTHVRQFRDGMTVLGYVWASRCGYRRNRYEVEARAVAAGVRTAVSPFDPR